MKVALLNSLLRYFAPNSKQNHGLNASFIQHVIDGHVAEVLQHLINNTVDKTYRSFQHHSCDGWTALHFAAKHGYEDLITLLVQYGFDINCESTKSGQTPLLVAIDKDASFPIITQLLGLGANVIADKKGNTVLHYAARRGCKTIMHHFLHEISTVDINMQNELGETCLHLAIYCRSYSVVQLLIQKKINVKLCDKAGKTAVHYAVQLGCIEIFHMMLMKAAFPLNLQDTEGKTLLHSAMEYQQPMMIKLLLQFGASLDMVDKCGHTVRDYAVRYGAQHLLPSDKTSLLPMPLSSVNHIEEKKPSAEEEELLDTITHNPLLPGNNNKQCTLTTPTTNTTITTDTTDNTPSSSSSILLQAINAVDNTLACTTDNAVESEAVEWSDAIVCHILTLLSILAGQGKIRYDYHHWCVTLQCLLTNAYSLDTTVPTTVTTITTHYASLRRQYHTLHTPFQPGESFDIDILSPLLPHHPHGVVASSQPVWCTLHCLVTNSFWTFITSNNSTLTSPQPDNMVNTMTTSFNTMTSSGISGSSSASTSSNAIFTMIPAIPCYFPGYEKEYFLSLAIVGTIITSSELRIQPKRVIFSSVTAGIAAYYLPGACDTFSNAMATVECLARGIDNVLPMDNPMATSSSSQKSTDITNNNNGANGSSGSMKWKMKEVNTSSTSSKKYKCKNK